MNQPLGHRQPGSSETSPSVLGDLFGASGLTDDNEITMTTDAICINAIASERLSCVLAPDFSGASVEMRRGGLISLRRSSEVRAQTGPGREAPGMAGAGAEEALVHPLSSAELRVVPSSSHRPGRAALRPHTMGRGRRYGRVVTHRGSTRRGQGEAGASKRQSSPAARARKSSPSPAGEGGPRGAIPPLPAPVVLCRNTLPFSYGTEVTAREWGGGRGCGPNQPTLAGVASGQRRTSDMAPSLCSSLF